MHEEERRANILDIKSEEGLRYLRSMDAKDLTTAEFDHIFKLCGALWLHSGDPKMPHAELTSGKCSNGFIDVLRVLKNANLCQILARELMNKILKTWDIGVDWVVGSDHAAATLSHSVAIWYNAQHDFTEKMPDGKQLWKRFAIMPGELVLQVEELITTTKTLQAVRNGIREGNLWPVDFIPVVGTLVHRSDVYEFDGYPIVYFAHYDIQTWEPSECPLCKAGSKRLRPKQNWAELIGQK
ncbi:MAG: hypothetical protein NTZ42_00975 [Candidatus Gribaldobacteria bacterium]|nr:hypothetical protein [Candidatus Gribaldobacteria bacterium]